MDHPAPRLGRAPGRLQAHVITATYSSADERAFSMVGWLEGEVSAIVCCGASPAAAPVGLPEPVGAWRLR